MLQVPMKVLPFDVLSVPEVQKNPSDRCYYCKNVIFRSILEAAAADGFTESWMGQTPLTMPATVPACGL